MAIWTNAWIPQSASMQDLVPLVVRLASEGEWSEGHRVVVEQKLRELVTKLQDKYPESPVYLVTVLDETVERWVSPLMQSLGITCSHLESDATEPDACHCQILLTLPAGTQQPLVTMDYGGMGETGFNSNMEKVNEFNRDARKHPTIIKWKNRLQPAMIDALPLDQRSLYGSYAFADGLAIRFQNNRKRTTTSLIFIAVLAALLYSLYTNAFSDCPAVLFFYPFSLVVGLIVFWWSVKRRGFYKHIEYRALAEALRIQFYFSMAGLDHNVADHYSVKQKTSMQWIWFAMHGIGSRPRGTGSGETGWEGLRFAKTHWIEEQIGYFGNRSKEDNGKLGRWNRGISWTYILGILLALGLWQADQCGVLFTVAADARKWWFVAIGLSPVISAAISTYLDKMAFVQQANSYVWMKDLFSEGDRQYEQAVAANDVAQAKQAILKLGLEALAENSDWFLYHRDRPLDIPRG